MDQEQAKKLVDEAGEIAGHADSWTTLSNALCDPHGGLIARYFPELDERQEFLRSPEYEQLNELMRRTIARTGLSPRQPGGKSASAG